jgi:7,8-dihydro-6-hydroxymethylpterin-pyrophosphokinase
MSQPPAVPRRLNVEATPEVQAGVYADFVGVWHQANSFVLDFSVYTSPPRMVEVDDQQVLNLSARMVARVRLPPSQIFEIMKALEQQLSRWEREHGGRGD